jgi:ABC-2 type transport system ATP-binding protein
MLEIIGLSKQFGDVQAVNDLNLTVQPGEIFTMLGANGAGRRPPLWSVLDSPSRHGEPLRSAA